ncbi:hypothetical protein OS493_022600 [Desmophyllum pertusum]|uniref:Uncharacterized protein n=1 Tax=Desmophyllum pertusum TaxID=174260 RepID=A0A9X0CSI5_9CNID|nr:hypothetical protein OS493_022600 [Desmophyllum pertusum]
MRANNTEEVAERVDMERETYDEDFDLLSELKPQAKVTKNNFQASWLEEYGKWLEFNPPKGMF